MNEYCVGKTRRQSPGIEGWVNVFRIKDPTIIHTDTQVCAIIAEVDAFHTIRQPQVRSRVFLIFVHRSFGYITPAVALTTIGEESIV